MHPSADGAPVAPPDAARLEWLWAEYEAQQAEIRQYQAEGMDIFPSPGFVVKSTLLAPPSRPSPQFPPLPPSQSGARLKFFVNLCSDPALAMPAMQPDGQGGEHLRVPISAGPVVLGVDRDGETPVLVSDVVLNPETVSRAANDRDFRAFMAQFALQKLQDKYHCKLGLDELKFPKMRYKGSLPPPSQHIRRPKGAHIEPEDPHAAERAEQEPMQSDERMEERRRAAQLARIEALRAMEERESGIVMGASGTISTAASGDIYTSTAAAEAAAAAEQGRSPMERFVASKESAKIEVMPDEPAPPRSQSHVPAQAAAAAAASSTAAASASAASPAVAAASSSSSSPSSSLPTHSIWYLKSGSGTTVPATEWDVDASPPPASIRVGVELPLAGSAGEMEVEITKEGVTIYSNSDHRGKHQYQLHMQFPFLLDDEHSECKFSKKTRVLTLTLPVTELKPLPDVEPEVSSAATPATTAAPTAPAIDWKAKLGLTNTMMYQLVSEV